MKLGRLLTEIKLDQINYPELIDDFEILWSEFGGPSNRGSAEKFNRIDILSRLSLNFKTKNPPILYRGLSFQHGTEFDEKNLTKYISGVRSWSKNKTSAIYYTWSGWSPLRILLVWINPEIIVDGDILNKKAKMLGIKEPLDDRECIANAHGRRISRIEVDSDTKPGFPLYIVNIE